MESSGIVIEESTQMSAMYAAAGSHARTIARARAGGGNPLLIAEGPKRKVASRV
jgi:hypothetical protein